MGGADGMPSVFRDGSEFWSGPVQGGMDDGKDTKMISDMLRKQSELLHMMEDYVEDHHKPDTFDMSDVWIGWIETIHVSFGVEYSKMT